MTIYKTYQEAKIANPDSEIFVSMCGEFATSDHVGYVSMCGTGEGWNPCDHADYCMSVYDFLKSGNLFVDGDVYLSKNGDGVIEVGCTYSCDAIFVNNIVESDKNLFVLRAKALEESQGYTAVTKPFFELQKEFEAGGNNRLIPVEVTSTDGVIASELDPIGDVQELKKELAALGLTANEAIEILRKSRLSKQDQRKKPKL
jgi:hypothetical protein